MPMPLTVSILILLFNIVILISLSVIFWNRRRYKGGIYGFLLMVAMSLWSIASLHELVVPGASLKIIYGGITYIGIVVMGPLLLLFSLEYAQYSGLIIKKLRSALFILPAFVLLSVLLNNQLHWVWVSIVSTSQNIFAPLEYLHGPLFYVNWLYQIILLAVSVLILFQYSIHLDDESKRRQIYLVIIAILLPLLVNIVYNVVGISSVKMDITPYFFSITGLAIFHGMFMYKFFDITAKSKEFVYENMRSGVLVFAQNGKLVDKNGNAKSLISERIKHYSDLPWTSNNTGKTSGIFYCDKTEKWLEYRIFDLSHVASEGGTIVTLYDVTEIHETESSIAEEEEIFSSIIETLPDGLFAINNQSQITLWNEQMEKITGVSAKVLLGKKGAAAAEMVYGKKQPLLTDAVLNDAVFFAEYKNIKKKGEQLYKTIHFNNRYYSAVATKLKNTEGETIGAIESLRDITETHDKEDSLSKHMSELLKLNDVMVDHEVQLTKLSRGKAK